MKKQLLMPCFLLAAASLNAQQHFDLFRKNDPDKHRSFINTLLTHQASSNTAQKPTGLQQRVIAQAMFSAEDGLEDTLTYKYSGTRGSVYNHNIIDDFGYQSDFMSEYASGPYAEMGAQKNDVLADSIVQYDGATPVTTSKAFYRADNKIDSFFTYYEGGPSVNTEKTKHVYNSSGKITQYVNTNDFMNPPGFDTSFMGRLWYNTAGTQLLRDTFYLQNSNNVEPFYTTTYHYNSQNNLDSVIRHANNSGTGYDIDLLTTIFYDAANRINKVVQIQYMQFDTITSIDTFGYTGTLPFFTFYESRSYWDDEPSVMRITKHVGSNNLPDSAVVTSNENGPIEIVGILKYAYNAYNNPDSVIGINPDGTFAGRYNFYYETYDDGITVGVKDVASAKHFKVYPNPFNNNIHIAWSNAQAQFKISLVNTIGQTVFTANKYLTTGDNSIDLPGVSDGNYILLLQDEKGNTYNSKLLKR